MSCGQPHTHHLRHASRASRAHCSPALSPGGTDSSLPGAWVLPSPGHVEAPLPSAQAVSLSQGRMSRSPCHQFGVSSTAEVHVLFYCSGNAPDTLLDHQVNVPISDARPSPKAGSATGEPTELPSKGTSLPRGGGTTGKCLFRVIHSVN